LPDKTVGQKDAQYSRHFAVRSQGPR